MHSKFEDISIYSANGFGMFQSEGGNNSFMCGPILCISSSQGVAHMASGLDIIA